jgi:hypothetical protein
VLFSPNGRIAPARAVVVDHQTQPPGIPREPLDRQQSGLYTLCVLDEDRLEERAVAMTEQALLDTQEAFDSVAATYDRSNSENAILCAPVASSILDAVPAPTMNRWPEPATV